MQLSMCRLHLLQTMLADVVTAPSTKGSGGSTSTEAEAVLVTMLVVVAGPANADPAAKRRQHAKRTGRTTRSSLMRHLLREASRTGATERPWREVGVNGPPTSRDSSVRASRHRLPVVSGGHADGSGRAA